MILLPIRKYPTKSPQSSIDYLKCVFILIVTVLCISCTTESNVKKTPVDPLEQFRNAETGRLNYEAIGIHMEKLNMKGMYAKVLREFGSLVNDPDNNNALIFNEIGLSEHMRGNYTSARLLYQKSLKLDPDFWDPNYNMAITDAKDGKYELSYQRLIKLKKRKPHHTNLNLWIEYLEDKVQ